MSYLERNECLFSEFSLEDLPERCAERKRKDEEQQVVAVDSDPRRGLGADGAITACAKPLTKAVALERGLINAGALEHTS